MVSVPYIENVSNAPGTRRAVRFADADLEAVFRGDRFLLFDGAMGTMIQAAGLDAGHIPELLCLTDPSSVTAIHAAYVEAGSEVITSNTFGANARKLDGEAAVSDVFAAAVSCARKAGARYVAADIGPIGALLEPMGTMPFDDAYDLFAEEVDAAVAAGADIILIETMADLLEAKAAVLAAKEHSDLPIIASMTFGEDGRTFLGTSPQIAAMTLSALGVQALGMNCSLGPDELAGLVDDVLAYASCPVIVQANAGLPRMVGDRTEFPVGPEEYCAAVGGMLEKGVGIVGGCCGTDPSYIAGLAALIAEFGRPAERRPSVKGGVASAQRAVVLDRGHVAVVGERINPTGKKKLKEALRCGDVDYIIGEAINQAEAGADILDVNAGLPEIDEPSVLKRLVGDIQAVSSLPLQIDSADPAALEAGVRVYAGKPIINSVNGKQDNLRSVIPLAVHYGCALVGLTLDEQGIPETAEGRFAIAERIVDAALDAGMAREDIYIDCLAMAVSTDQRQAGEILRAIRMVTEHLGVHAVLGVSNISFGLPARDRLNASFLTAAFACGLDLPIVNPLSDRIMAAVDAWRVFNGQDEGAVRFIERHAADDAHAVQRPVAVRAQGPESGGLRMADSGTDAVAGSAAASPAGEMTGSAAALRAAVLNGKRADVPALVAELSAREGAMAVIDGHLIPALDEVGERFDDGRFFLPQLLASAEAAKAGFDAIRETTASEVLPDKGKVALATVKGDIHDIGKNIVKMLLENYGYQVYDLGRDVEPEAVLACVREHGISLVGLSALMTTTVKSMEETIALLRREAPGVKVFVGGAVLNEEYAEMVGADFYAKDAAESARIAARVLGD